ncbi:DUF4333 domain-containing protein [Nocardia sp. NPDC057668]|uniref:DUF4333 domain-containing protein n=1 Tax=Nocardia sp. NPDC057668 TaxID=3346202 RepID=UPI0036735BC6
MRRWVVVLSALLVSGCGLFGPDELSGGDVAEEVGQFFRSASGDDAKSLKCDAVDAEVGAKTKCTAIDRYDEKWGMTAVVKTVDGTRIMFGTTFDDELADNVEVQKSLASALKKKTGREVGNVQCAGIQKLEPYAERTCTVIESNGARWEVDANLSSLSGVVSVTFKDTLLYAQSVENVVASLAHNLSRHYGFASMTDLRSFMASKGSCPNMLRGNPGDTIHCQAILADNSTTDVTVRATKSEEGRIYFELFPDNAPDLSMSGWQLADPS